MSLIRAIEISASGLTAQRRRFEVIASNLANLNATRTPEGGPYRRRDVVFSAMGMGDRPFLSELEGEMGVVISEVVVDNSEPQRVYDPGHPDADPQGYVALPNINPVEEMANLISAARSFQANLAAIAAARDMLQRSLDIAR